MEVLNSKTLTYIFKLLKILPSKRRRKLLYLMPIAIFSGLADVFVVFLVARLFNSFVGIPNRPAIPYPEALDVDPRSKILGLVFIYIFSTWIASISKLILKASQVKLKTTIWRDLSEIAHKKILAQKYEYFLSSSRSSVSATVLMNISQVANIVVLPLLQLVSGFFVVIFISFAVLSIAKYSAVSLIIAMIIGFTSISLLITPFLRKASLAILELNRNTNKVLQESMRTILDVHLTGSEPYFERQYKLAGRKSIPIIWKAEVLPEFPRALLEPFGITMIFAIGIIPVLTGQSNYQNVYEIIPFLATIAVASLKLTPPLQDAFRAYTSLRAGLPHLKETLNIVDLPIKRMTLRSIEVPSIKSLIPGNYIELSNVTYKYPTSKFNILNNINIKIKVGTKIALVGKTGSGKTTTANLMLGLLRPSNGHLKIDNLDLLDRHIPAWQGLCAYVPQSINLLNSDIVHNVAFGCEDKNINLDKVWESLKAAQLEDLVKNMPNKLYENIGDNGIRISGGQRQRLAIARAFYRDAKFIILDEATSALDNKTENQVMNSIDFRGKNCTILIIAHRLSTVIKADKIYEFEEGKIKAQGTYEELKEKSITFRELTDFNKIGNKLID